MFTDEGIRRMIDRSSHESKERDYYYNLDKISGKVGNNQITPSILNSVRDILNTIN